jgi:hypothetical protein
MALTGEPDVLARCAPGAEFPGLALELVAAGERPPEDTELVVAFATPGLALEPLLAPAAPPVLLWLDRPPPLDLRSQDRLISAVCGVEHAWRTLPLPVADARFAPLPLAPLARRSAWLGPAGERRRAYLDRHGGTQERWSGTAEIVMNLPEGESAGVTHDIAAALATGCLLVSETLTPSHGLEPGVDYLEARDPDDVYIAVENALRRPQAFRRIQLAGRRKAERFRASTLLTRVAHDLRRELAAARA